MYVATPNLLQEMLAGLKSTLDGGKLYVFAGAVPADASAALNTTTTHTQVAVFTEANDGTTGLTFGTPVGGLITKDGTEVWSGTVLFDGVDDSETTLTPTFFRFCEDGDDGRGVATGARIQGTVGGPSSGADFRLGADTVTANGTNTVGAAVFEVSIVSLG